MSEEIFCPVCKFKNDLNADQCKYCGVSLTEIRQRTTTKIQKIGKFYTEVGINPRITTFAVPVNSLAFFIMDDDEPLVIKNAQEIYLGRLLKSPSRQFINLEPYQALKLGVSRLHARISKEYSSVFIEDLNSKNGTWVNEKRVPSGEKIQLNHFDKIQLGHLHIVICFPPDKSGKTQPIKRNF